MNISNILTSHELKLRKCYTAFDEISLLGKTLLSMALALSIGLLAQMRVYLPWTPVPMVLTQIGVIVSIAVAGRKWGLVPILMYLLGGLAGIPWFSSYGSGIGYLLGPTGGYVIGFVLSAWFISSIRNSRILKDKLLPLFTVVLFSQLVLVFLPGLIQLNVWTKLTGGQAISLSNLLAIGFYPFVVGDILKSSIGTLFLYSIGRK